VEGGREGGRGGCMRLWGAWREKWRGYEMLGFCGS
jgi:hypothetical protein